MSPRGRRLLSCLLAAPVLTLLLAAAPARADADDDPAAEQALAERFAPVLMLVRQDHACGPGEPYSPSAVEVLFDNPTVALRGPWTSRDLVKVGPSAEDVSAGLPSYRATEAATDLGIVSRPRPSVASWPSPAGTPRSSSSRS